MFNKLPSNSLKLLQDILNADNPAQMLQERYKKCTPKEEDELDAIIRELTQGEYIRIPSWGDDMPMYVEINNSARTYSESEAEYEKQLNASAGVTYYINSTGSNIVFGAVVNSSLIVDSSIAWIENLIRDKGGDDKEALSSLLEEAKELIENIGDSRQIPKNKGFYNRLSSHLEKHGWFYGEIVGLIGTYMLMLLNK